VPAQAKESISAIDMIGNAILNGIISKASGDQIPWVLNLNAVY
jgi:hypothetical protein